MKLYYSPGACSMAVHIVIQELGLKAEAVKVDLQNKKTREGDYNKVNPKGYVPALQLDDGQVLTEAAVIMQYLADQQPEKNLAPRLGTMDRYRLMEWLHFISTEVHKGFGTLWRRDLANETKDLFKQTLTKRLAYLNEHLTTHQFVMGNQYTISDAYLFTVLNWSPMLQVDLTPYPKVMGYMEKIQGRPATQGVLKAEGLSK